MKIPVFLVALAFFCCWNEKKTKKDEKDGLRKKFPHFSPDTSSAVLDARWFSFSTRRAENEFFLPAGRKTRIICPHPPGKKYCFSHAIGGFFRERRELAGILARQEAAQRQDFRMPQIRKIKVSVEHNLNRFRTLSPALYCRPANS